MSFFSWFCCWFFTFQSVMLFNNIINLDSKEASCFTGSDVLKLRNPYLCWCFFFGVLKNCFPSHFFDCHFCFFCKLQFATSFKWLRDILCWNFKFKFLYPVCKVKVECSTGFWSIYSSGKSYLLALQRVLNESCEPKHWYIQRTDEKNKICSVLRVSYYHSSAK